MSQLIMTILNWFAEMGYMGILLGLMVEIIPSELVLGYGGYLVGLGKMTFWGAVLAGVVGGTMAQLFLYWAGYYGGRPFLLKYGKYILIKENHIVMAEEWFQRYGVGVIFTARFIPVVRHAISIPAGIARMSVWKFIFYTVAAVIPWTILFLSLGRILGENWQQIREITAPYIIPGAGFSVVLIMLYIIWKKNTTPPIVTVKKMGRLSDK
ncbi:MULTISPECIES: DedA family protein [Peribacillus]|uniref:DedA family protein n=2 Tax=Peribacillus simplex TaxID=1478 RepID=A0AAW7IG42_9BACI|nr:MULTISPECIES: DedA family protein [Peribacillus]MDM5454983.1 DedA family protein [Peribacillus simplex]MDV7764092.1 DedA family protein [Peribacillus sp. CSMR9]MDW7615078.1 DedA family protein [Peribacillus simplex]